MAAGVPCVAARVGGNREIIRDDKDGILVLPGSPSEMASGILRFLRDSEISSRLRGSALDRVRKSFSIDKTVAEMEALYEDVLSGSRAGCRAATISA
jgi:glycosyltransferase involved in cell wall biosynthesis